MPELRRTELSVRRERVVLLGLVARSRDGGADRELEELASLADTAGAKVVKRVVQHRDRIDPAFYVGRGKAAEVADLARELKADVVIVDEDLTPAQIRNLEEVTGVKVVDRSELILDIFATRAHTQQAKLQVELAQLQYTLPRLVRMWTHLERYEGGIGTRGPGEKQLEVDRRLVKRRIRDLKQDLQAIDQRKLREVHSRTDFFQVSLVGYTNAGKSTLMNRLTDAGVLVEDKLFATLDTRTRRWEMDSHLQVLLSDTVGFIRKLPHHLVASFQATLEEARHADLLLHVVDASHADGPMQAQAVLETLDAIGCHDTPKLTVLNKMDKADVSQVHALETRFRDTVDISALTGEGMDRLQQRVSDILGEQMVEVTVETPPGDGRVGALIASEGKVLEQDHQPEGSRYRVLIRRTQLSRFKSMDQKVRVEEAGH